MKGENQTKDEVHGESEKFYREWQMTGIFKAFILGFSVMCHDFQNWSAKLISKSKNLNCISEGYEILSHKLWNWSIKGFFFKVEV